MPDPNLPPYPANGNARIEIFGPDAQGGRWDSSLWDDAVWAGVGWRDVTPESMMVEISWGADDPSGVLTTTAAGSWTLKTYDPERKLDPSNGASIYAQSLRPGRPFRLSHVDANGVQHIVRQGLIDEVSYNIDTQTGSLRGTDTVSIMAAAKMLPGQDADPAMPNTLRARADYLVQKAGLGKLVSVEHSGDFGTIVLAHKPIHYYRMGQATPATDPAADLGTQPKNGVYGLGCTSVASLGQAGNNAISFNATGDWMQVPSGSALTLPSVFTIGMMFQYHANGPSQILTIWPVATGSLFVRLTDTRQIEIVDKAARGMGARSVTFKTQGVALPEVANDVWITRDAEKLIVVLNGVPEKFDNPPAFHSGAGSMFRMGGNGGAPGGFIMDEYMMFDRVLAGNDIATLRDLMYGNVGTYDPPVAKITDKEASVWALVQTAAYDALYTAWVDRLGILRFRSFGDPRDNGLAVGGADGLGIETVDVNAGLANVYTRIIAYDETAPEVEVIRASDLQSIIYGDITLRRQNPVPAAGVWADSVLADRSGAALQYVPGTIYPQTVDELIQLVDLDCMDIMHLRVDSVEPSIDIAARVLGARITCDTGTGWTFNISSYIPASEWAEDVTPPIEPPNPNPPPTKTVTRIYQCIKDTRAARTSGGSNYGAGTEGEIPIGAWQGWRNRGLFDFDQINFSDVVEVEKCELLLNTTTQVNVGFGSTPKVTIKRITENWSEGSAANPAANNSTIYPGPSVTNASSVTRTLPSTEQVPVALAMSDICRSWMKGSAQYGVALYSAGEDNTKYTTEVWDRSYSNVDGRPKLRLTLKVLA